MRFALLAGVLATGCEFTTAALDPGSTPTPDAQPMSPDGQPDGMCAAASCDQGSLVTCDGTSTACPAGCVEAASNNPAHCGVWVPSYGVSLAFPLLAGVEPKTLATGRYVVDTDNGSIFRCGTGADPTELVTVRDPDPGVKQGIFYQRITVAGPTPDISIFAFTSLTIAADAELYAFGGPSLALVTDGPLVIAGAVRLVGGEFACSATTACAEMRSFNETQAECPAPGGGEGGNREENGHGAGAGQQGNADGEGGGGGAHASIGGTGGKSGGAGGEPFTLGPLQGGGGGAGGRNDGGDHGGHGGGGGGALQLVSATSVTLTAPGINGGFGITVGGGGGTPGEIDSGGGGGGAGGMLLIEAPALNVTNAFLLANGGGGGSGTCMGGVADLLCWGITSDFSLTAAPGGDTGASGTAQLGGDGGAGETLAGSSGQPAGATATGGGGGGGSTGRIILRTLAGGAMLVDDRSSPEPVLQPLTVQ